MELIDSFYGYRNFLKAKKDFKKIVFFSEKSNYFIFFIPLIKKLLEKNIKVSFVTSDKKDPIFDMKSEYLKTFYIGEGVFRTFFFANLNCDNLLLTMPDLGENFLKKSPFCKNYIYIFHSLISSTLAYKKNAFKNYDTFFCVGRHHVTELENFFKENKIIEKKRLLRIGYFKLDEIIKTRKSTSINNNQILIAPTWGSDNIINSYCEEIIEKLLKLNYKIILRPHPMSIKLDHKKLSEIDEKFSSNDNFSLSKKDDNSQDYLKSEIIISDWSGAALEFCLGLNRSAIFIDTPQRVRNKEYLNNKSIQEKTFEYSVRGKLGQIIKTNEIHKITEYINLLKKNTGHYESNLSEINNNFLFNVGSSVEKACDYLEEQI